MDREHLIGVIAREMYETDFESGWAEATRMAREAYLMDAGFMVDGIARAMTEWLLAAGEVGIARKWGVAMRRIDDDAAGAAIQASSARERAAEIGEYR